MRRLPWFYISSLRALKTKLFRDLFLNLKSRSRCDETLDSVRPVRIVWSLCQLRFVPVHIACRRDVRCAFRELTAFPGPVCSSVFTVGPRPKAFKDPYSQERSYDSTIRTAGSQNFANFLEVDPRTRTLAASRCEDLPSESQRNLLRVSKHLRARISRILTGWRPIERETHRCGLRFAP